MLFANFSVMTALKCQRYWRKLHNSAADSCEITAH